jgi:hypothetical protein
VVCDVANICNHHVLGPAANPPVGSIHRANANFSHPLLMAVRMGRRCRGVSLCLRVQVYVK